MIDYTETFNKLYARILRISQLRLDYTFSKNNSRECERVYICAQVEVIITRYVKLKSVIVSSYRIADTWKGSYQLEQDLHGQGERSTSIKVLGSRQVECAQVRQHLVSPGRELSSFFRSWGQRRWHTLREINEQKCLSSHVSF